MYLSAASLHVNAYQCSKSKIRSHQVMERLGCSIWVVNHIQFAAILVRSSDCDEVIHIDFFATKDLQEAPT